MVTTSAAAKTALVIQEDDGDESGWIFGMISGSEVAEVTDRNEVWDELVLDSGSVSNASPYSWCADIRVNDKEKAYLQDIQQRRIPSHGSRVVPLVLWGPEGNVQCMVKFDVADVAFVVSLEKMIETGFTFSFDDYKMLHAQGQQTCGDLSQSQHFRVADETQLAVRGMVAPIDGPSRCGENEMDVAEDSTCAEVGTAAAEAALAVRTRVDEPGDDPPPRRPREVRPCSTRQEQRRYDSIT